MKKKLASILLCLCMVLTLLPTTAMAASSLSNLNVTYAVSEEGKLQSVTAKFNWSTASATSRLVLMEKKLRSAGESGSDSSYGDLTNLGFYGNTFDSWDAVETYDKAEATKGTFSIIAHGNEAAISNSSTNTVTIDLQSANISLSKNKTYYVYLWTYWAQSGQEHYYPDALVCALQVQDGGLKVAPATDRNSYNAFQNATIAGTTKYSVTVTAGTGMATTSTQTTQSNLDTAMTPVVYTAAEGYYFPDSYSVATSNGIMVRRDSASQITVYGTPSNNATITLTAATVKGTRTTAPTGLTGSDGKINGTTAAMEYNTSADATTGWTACTADATTVAAGTYYIRYAATDDKTASPTATVTVPDGSAVTTDTMTFGYAYDVQRNPANPTTNDTVDLWGFAKPYKDTSTQADPNGTWTLTRVGTYGSYTGKPTDDSKLGNIANGIVTNYGVDYADNVPIYELTLNGTRVTYGVVQAQGKVYDAAANGTVKDSKGVLFVGVTLTSGSTGYFLTSEEGLISSGCDRYMVVGEDASGQETVTVSFNKNCDDSSVTVPYDTYVVKNGTLTSAQLPTLSCGGYTFGGWYTDANCTEANKVTTTTTFSADTTLYAKWTAAPSTPSAPTVTITRNGVTLTPSDTVKVGEILKAKVENAPTGATVTYQWTYDYDGDNTFIADAISDTYKVEQAYVGKQISVIVRINGTPCSATTGRVEADSSTPSTSGGSSGGSTGASSYAVTIPPAGNGSVTSDRSTARKGDTVTITVTPAAGYQVDGVVVKDQNGKTITAKRNADGTYSFTMPAGKVTVEPVFVWENPFVDVKESAYYAAAVEWALKNGITGGTDDTHFSPDAACTRGQLVTFLYRWAVANGVDVSVGEDTNILSYNDAFSIPEYAIPAFQWAVGAGILQGNGGNLMPNQTCTRAQAVAFLFRFAQSTGMDTSVGEDTNILSYNDAFNVPEYAISAFQWAVGAGIVQGNDGNLLPNNTCTRAQIVTFLYRLLGTN